MAVKENRITLRGVPNSAKKDLVAISKRRHTSINGEVLLAIDQYISEWRRSTPDWFITRSKKLI